MRLVSLVSVELWDSPWPEGVSVLDSEQGSRVERVVEEAVKGSEAAAGIVDEVMGERHLIDNGGDEAVSARISWFVNTSAVAQGFYTPSTPLRRLWKVLVT